jgi:hypothetical protein
MLRRIRDVLQSIETVQLSPAATVLTADPTPRPKAEPGAQPKQPGAKPPPPPRGAAPGGTQPPAKGPPAAPGTKP